MSFIIYPVIVVVGLVFIALSLAGLQSDQFNAK